jgi:inorganic triphosphatase YgiF
MGEMTPAEAAEYVLALKDCTPFLKQRAACDQAAEALAQLPAARAEVAVLRHITDLHRDLTREQDQALRVAQAQIDQLREAISDAIPHVPYRVEQDLRAALDQAAPEQHP